MAVDLANVDGGLLFGAQLGRSEPIAVSSSEVAEPPRTSRPSAACSRQPREQAHRWPMTPPSAPLPPLRTLTRRSSRPRSSRAACSVWTRQIYRLFSDTPEEAGALVVALDEVFEEMPAADGVGILDGATAAEQVVTIALAYADEADAALAAEVLPRRFEALPSLTTGEPLAALLADRDVTSISARVAPGAEGVAPAAVVELRARHSPALIPRRAAKPRRRRAASTGS